MKFIVLVLLGGLIGIHAAEPVRALIIDGRNNHDWRSTTDHLRATLEAAGRFEVTASTAPQLRFPNVPRKAKRSEDESALTEARKHFEKPQAEAKADLAPRWDKCTPLCVCRCGSAELQRGRMAGQDTQRVRRVCPFWRWRGAHSRIEQRVQELARIQ